MEGLGVEKSGKEREGGIREKGWQGWKTPPLLFPEITDYLTQINNLSKPKEVAGEGGGGRGFRGFEVRVVRRRWWDSAPSVVGIVGGERGLSWGEEE